MLVSSLQSDVPFAFAESIKRRVLVLLPSIFKDELFLSLPFGLDSQVNKFKFEFMAAKLRFSEKCDQDTTHINTVRFQRNMQIFLDFRRECRQLTHPTAWAFSEV